MEHGLGEWTKPEKRTRQEGRIEESRCEDCEEKMMGGVEMTEKVMGKLNLIEEIDAKQEEEKSGDNQDEVLEDHKAREVKETTKLTARAIPNPTPIQ